MIMHLPGPVASPRGQAGRRLNRAARFSIHIASGREPRGACSEQPIPGIVAERRIEKNHLEKAAFACDVGARIADMQLEGVGAEHRLRDRNRFDGRWAAIDGNRERRSARGGFEREHAGSRIEIETSPSSQILTEPVEQRFADTIGGGPQSFAGGEAHPPAAPGTADDPNAVRGIRLHAGYPK